MDPLAYNEVRTRPSLEEHLESIVSGAALMADSSCTRDDRRERIVHECQAVRQALQDLLTEYMNNVSENVFTLMCSGENCVIKLITITISISGDLHCYCHFNNIQCIKIIADIIPGGDMFLSLTFVSKIQHARLTCLVRAVVVLMCVEVHI